MKIKREKPSKNVEVAGDGTKAFAAEQAKGKRVRMVSGQTKYFRDDKGNRFPVDGVKRKGDGPVERSMGTIFPNELSGKPKKDQSRLPNQVVKKTKK